MSTKKPGRPPKEGTLRNPPAHIKSRILSRGGKPPSHMVLLLADMERLHQETERYRRQLRITHEQAAVLINGPCSVITEQHKLHVDSLVPSMRRLGQKGGVAKGKSTPAWVADAKNICPRYLTHSASRAAELAYAAWPPDRPKPSVRTLRKFISEKK
jgi:hypothetical protein